MRGSLCSTHSRVRNSSQQAQGAFSKSHNQTHTWASNSQNHTDLHTDTGTEHQRDPRRSHPNRDTRNHKPATATTSTEITHPYRPTEARLGAHGGRGGPIGLEAHEVRQLSHLGFDVGGDLPMLCLWQSGFQIASSECLLNFFVLSTTEMCETATKHLLFSRSVGGARPQAASPPL